jgi:hypothetical protein
MKFLLLLFVFACTSAYGQDAGAMAAQQANDLAQQATQQALQMQQQNIQTTNMIMQQMMTSASDIYFPQSSGPVIGFALPPAFSFKSGKVASGSQVVIRSPTHYATIYYTTDGWTPNARSPRYTGPITITREMRIQAIAVGPNLLHSSVARADYWVTAPSKTPAATTAPIPALIANGVLHAGTPLHLTTGAEISSNTAEVGDKIPLLLDQDVKVGDSVVAAKGTPVNAVLTVADPAGRRGVPGDLVFEVRSLNVQGKTIHLNGGEILEGGTGRERMNAVIEPGMAVIATVAVDSPLRP